jgi:hypothetical protein
MIQRAPSQHLRSIFALTSSTVKGNLLQFIRNVHDFWLPPRCTWDLRSCTPSQCFSNFVKLWPGKFFFYKTRARSQQIIGLQAIFTIVHKRGIPFPEC